jgi:SAM-dependent methyltransferase
MSEDCFKEEEIRPAGIFDEYLSLARIDCSTYFSNDERVRLSCPACNQPGEFAFDKNGFVYEHCSNCYTLFVSPRPLASAFSRYYTESESAKYWATTFYKKTAEARREKIWKPKAELIKNILQSHQMFSNLLIDIGGGYGVFAEVMRELAGYSVTVIEPSNYLADVCKQKGFNVIEKFLEEIQSNELPTSQKTFVSFELFEHLHDPGYFLQVLFSLMAKGDFFIFTTLSSSGVDIQALWQDSKAVSPPHHLNFFNPYSIRLLLERHAFNVLEISTPGKLDIDILEKNRTQIKDRFWRMFVDQASVEQKEKMQEFIAEQGISSHMMVVCCK